MMKMMIFNRALTDRVLLHKIHRPQLFRLCLLVVVTVLCPPLINAEVSVNTGEKNDKVITGAISTELQVAKQALPEQLLYAEQWELARSGESVLSLPVLNQVINRWLENKQQKIQIQYPGGEEGELWVQELTDWMVSLAIPSNKIVTEPGSGADDVIKFDLIN